MFDTNVFLWVTAAFVPLIPLERLAASSCGLKLKLYFFAQDGHSKNNTSNACPGQFLTFHTI